MITFRRGIEHAGLFLLGTLTILLLFESELVLPDWIRIIGRMHPILLHFPIVLVTILFFLEVGQKKIGFAFENEGRRWFLSLMFLLTVLTAIMGLILSKEETYGVSELLSRHKWSAVAFCYLLYAMVLFRGTRFYKVALIGSFLLVIVAGHLGASITHGADFLTSSGKSEVKPGVSSVFNDAIHPIINVHCKGCHNPNKLKGGLDLSSYQGIMKGGENGTIINIHNPENSDLIRRTLLPLDHEDHMPPPEKGQLTELEIQVLKHWVQNGAGYELSIDDPDVEDSLILLSILYIDQLVPKVPDRPFSDPKEIKRLNNPFRSVIQVTPSSPDIEVSIFVRSMYTPKWLTELEDIKDNVVSLNLTGLPINDQDLAEIGTFKNLRNLNLNRTDIQGDGLKNLRSLENLEYMSLAGTSVNSAAIRLGLAGFKGLKEVFLWDTKITKQDIDLLSDTFIDIQFQLGYEPEDEPPLQLSVPLIVNEKQVLKSNEKVGLKHGLKEVTIRFTLDGTDPDSINSPVYQQPFGLTGLATLKTRAFKEGWLGSITREIKLFEKGHEVSNVNLTTPPSPKYYARGPGTLTDGVLGNANNFSDGISWLGFQGGDIEIRTDMGEAAPETNKVIISYGIAMSSGIMAPTKMQLLGGEVPDEWTFLGEIKISPAMEMEQTRSELLSIDFEKASYRYFKVTIHPLEKLPKWHPLIDYDVDPWVFLDEIFFY